MMHTQFLNSGIDKALNLQLLLLQRLEMMSQKPTCMGCGMILPDWDFFDGPLVEKPPSNEGDIGLIPGPGTRISHARDSKVCEPLSKLQSPRALDLAHHN